MAAADEGEDDMDSMASLMRTFLPDNENLHKSGSASALLHHVEATLSKPPILPGSVLDLSQNLNVYSSVPKQNLNVYSNETSAYDQAYSQIKEATKVVVTNKDTLATSEQPSNGLQEMGDNADGDKRSQDLDPEWEPEHEDIEELESNNSDSDATIDLPFSEIEAVTSPTKKSNKSYQLSSILPLPKTDVCEDSGKRFACFVCEDTYKDLECYKDHMASHCFDRMEIKCFDCGEKFNRRQSYNAHRRLSTYELWADKEKKQRYSSMEDTTKEELKEEDESELENFICNECGCPSIRYKTFLAHIKTHTDISYGFRCSACPESFPSPCQLRQHIDSMHQLLEPFQCDKCLRRFKLRCSLVTHSKYCEVDPESNPYAKEIAFIDQLSQQRRYQGAEPEQDGLSQFSCPICMEMFDSPHILKTHLSFHDETKPFKCDDCGRGFGTKRALQKHEGTHLRKMEESDCLCKICGVQLLTRSGYNAHLRGHRNQEMLQAEATRINAPSSQAGYAPLQPPSNSTSQSAADLLKQLKLPERSIKTEDEQASGKKSGGNKKPKNYACPMCGVLFHSGGEKFQAHVRREHKDADLEKCNICNKQYFGKENLIRHLRMHQMYSSTFTCDDCGKVFRRKHALEVHKKLHTFKKFVSCDICGQEFRFVSEVDKHKHLKHRYDKMLNIYKCSICSQRFPMLSHLAVHCHSHNMPDAKPFECDLCKVSYANSTELKQHIYQKHDKLMSTLGESVYIPSTGSFISFPGGAESSDGVVVKPEEIDHINGQNDQVTCGNDHTTCECDGHHDCEDIKPDLSKLPPFPIDNPTTPDMSKLSTFPMDLSTTTTSKVQTDNIKTETDMESVGADAKETYVEAYNWATRQSSFQAKMLKRYVCEVCDKAFSSNSDLKTHRRTHSGETPFKCDFCERSFKQRGHRKLHIQVVHTKEMPYKCHLCDSAFPTRYRYQVHIKRHSGVKEYKCDYCEKEYYTFGKMNEHKKKRHVAECQQEAAMKAAQVDMVQVA